MTRNGLRAAPLDRDCTFDVYTSFPMDHAEIATIDVHSGNAGYPPYSIPDLKELIQPYVCDAGGDAAVAVANGHGAYIKAIVVKRVPRSSPLRRSEGFQSSGGCQNDSQCKGERVCESGRCVSPQ